MYSRLMKRNGIPFPLKRYSETDEDENFHAANEFIRISDIEKGERAYRLLCEHIGDRKTK